MYLFLILVILPVLAAIIFNCSIDYFNCNNSKTIYNTVTHSLLFDDGWKRESSYHSEKNGYYLFSKNNFVIHFNRENYVLSNVVPTIHTVKKYSKLLTYNEVVDIIELVKKLS
jgi:hypothetical protein